MFFQINITPKEKKVAEPMIRAPVINEYSLVLAPFQPPTRIKLDTKINTRVECTLHIKNSNNRSLTASITKTPPQERCINLSAIEWSLQPESEVDLIISWDPKESGSWRDILQLSDSRRIKYDIPLTLTCIDPNKVANDKKGVKTKQRNPLGPKIQSTSNIKKNTVAPLKNNTSKIKQEPPKIKVQPPLKRPVATEFADKENVSNVGFNWMLEQAKTKKQKKDQTPSPPLDFSKYLDSSTFKFTPLKSKFSCFEPSTVHNNVSFVPTNEFEKIEKITVESTVEMKLRKETYVTVPKYLKVDQTCDNLKDENDEFDDSLSPKQVSTETPKPKLPSEMSMLLNDIKFTPFKNPSAKIEEDTKFSPTFCSTGTKSNKSKSFENDSVSKNATFDIESVNNSSTNHTYELSVSPTSTKNSSHLKPTCLAKTFNRNNLDMGFSTPLSVNKLPNVTIDHKRYSNVFSKSQVDFGSARDCLEADLWVKSKNTSLSPISKNLMHSTLDSITEEDLYDHDITDKSVTNSTEPHKNSKKSKAFCIEISPPKKGSFTKPPIRKISPTKSIKIMKDKHTSGTVNAKKKVQINKSIKSNGTIQMSGVRIAKLSLSGLAAGKDKDKSKTKPKTKPLKEASVKLHDPNDFLSMFCNPDPFAATMTIDPFLASTLYCDEKWMFVQELEFKKWLNMLMTPPEQLSTDIESTPLDVGKVWQSCRAKEDVALAETKESISARYHTTTRLNTLRKAACAMFRKPEVITALSQTTVGIEKEILLIRQDKDLHRLQKTILELFISYNPLWLRIGLETVYGETIPLQSNNDLIGLSRFLIHRFFSDPFLVKTHSSHAHPNIRLGTFQSHMNKFMLKKFLFVVYFLDYAKRNKLIGHDPCLFHKKALIKDSRSILLTFSRELLSGIGDITKVLRGYNYVVSHKQTFLDEYDYAVVNLCTDLRDGVRLCRVMELITGQRCLTCRCRVPAISRLQKVHNVSIALTTLNEAGYTITGDIDAKSIADGHKEKTLSLLWQIIYKFQAPRFEKAAKTVQRWWRSKLWYVYIKKMLRNRRHNAASVIQRAWKCYLARRELQKLKEEYARLMHEKIEAAKKIQLQWRLRKEAKQQQKQLQLVKSSAIKIQRWWRKIRSTKPYVEEFKRQKNVVIKVQRRWRAKQLMKYERHRFTQLKTKVIEIQTLWKARRLGRQVFLDYQNKRRTIIFVQRKWRVKLSMKLEQKRYSEKLRAIRFIQEWWKLCLTARRDRNHFLALKNCVRAVEKVWIAKHTVIEERKQFLRQKDSAIMIQKAWRNYRATKADVQRYKRKKTSCLQLQTWWRSVTEANKYRKQRLNIIKIQRWWRSAVLTKKERSNFLAKKNAAIVFQKNWRMHIVRKEYKRKKSSVLKIELLYQNLIETRKVRNEYLKLKNAVTVVEARWIALKTGRKTRAKYLKTKNAAIVLQRRWRARVAMREARQNYLQFKRCTIIVQSQYRMRQERRRYRAFLQRKAAAIVLQRRWRAKKCGKQVRETYTKHKSSVISIQRKWRATLQARLERNEFLQKRKAVIVLQKHWRSLVTIRQYKKTKNAVRIIEKWRTHKLLGRQVRSEYLQLRACTIKMQRLARVKQHVKRFQMQRESVIVVQKHWRSYVAIKEYRRKKIAATAIQTWRRSIVTGRKVRAEYLKFRESVIKVQRMWRTIKQMREFKRQRVAAIVIQKHWKSYVAFKEYKRKKLAATVIQTWRRNIVTGRQVRAEYFKYRECVIKVQSTWRMKQAVRGYRQKREAVITMQKHWKRIMAVRKYEKIKIAVLFIENWRRHTLFGRQQRKEFIQLKTAVIKMQVLVRVKLQVQSFKRQRNAAIKIQRFWRSHLQMKECQLQYEKQRAAVIALQRRYRAKRIAEQVRRDYRFKTLAVTRIQRWWRRIYYLRKLRIEIETRKWAALVIENWWINSSEERRLREAMKAEMRRQYRAAVIIQAAWRGFKVRQAASKKMSMLRERAKEAAKAAVPSATLACRLQENIEIFKYASNIGQLSVCLSSLDVIIRLSPNACINVCRLNAVPRLYDILTRANRSLPWLDVCLKVISILLTLAKFQPTTKYVLEKEHIEVLARLLTIAADKKEDLFLHTATLIWVLTEDEEYAEAVKNDARTKFLLRSLCNSTKNKPTTNTTKCKLDLLPSPKPDWGLNHRRPRTFKSISQAIASIASRLGLVNVPQTFDIRRSFNFSM
ncbi:hypothetical protein TSAR_016715 [Trichomalopsis sarcophagae]|uniref:Calponin-homology (CH) domain-containing protein n=1 Tax=Trichomalopsis sarcophagae TaxID=543379 RepID=A0A232FIK5_9HYME|nr:hypothetical protein TSAR_016715 [Trichomalopsis sarcophagae]